MTHEGRLIVLSGPSGVGKNTIARILFERRANLRFSVSATTRAPRKGERPGEDYEFVSADEFARMRERAEFLEHAQVHGFSYGTPRKPVERLLAEGFDVLLDIDCQGGLQVFASGISCLSIFLLPPSAQELCRRLKARASETEESLARRFGNAGREIEAASHYDYTVVNADVAECVCAVETILDADRCRTVRQARFLAQLKEEFASC